jgi:hypothetical protein
VLRLEASERTLSQVARHHSFDSAMNGLHTFSVSNERPSLKSSDTSRLQPLRIAASTIGASNHKLQFVEKIDELKKRTLFGIGLARALQIA